MNGISVIIPAREEKYMVQTIYDVLDKAEGPKEVIAIYDGYEPDREIKGESDIKIVHNKEAIGQRQAVNQGAELAQYDYILKCDGHTMFDQGFDRKLIDNCEHNWTVLPTMYNLNAVKWEPKWHKKTNYMFFRSPFAKERPMRIQYWDAKTARAYPEEYRAYKAMAWRKGKITEVMNGQGACFFMLRDWFFALGGMDTGHGHWGQMGVELACKTWLAGGKHMVNKNTWFSHLFRSKFPWPASGRGQQRARKYSIDMWKNNKWPGQVRPLSWIIEKFWPVPTWTAEHIARVSKLNGQAATETGAKVSDRPIELRSRGKATITQDLTLLYYTANVIDKTLQKRVLEQLMFTCPDAPVVIISQGNMEVFFENKVLKNYSFIDVGDIGRSLHNIYKQVEMGLKKVKTEYVALVEDDILYTPDHFNHRPDCFAYNLNRWCLHTDDGSNTYSYRRGPVLSQLIAPTKLLREWFEARAKVEVPRKYCGEPGVFDEKIGITPFRYGTFESKQPNVVVCHKDGTMGRKYHGKDAEPTDNLAPWGNSIKLINKLFGKEEKVVKFGRGSWKNWQHSYIGSIVFKMEEIMEWLPTFARKGTEKRAAIRMKVFPEIIRKVADGEIKSDEDLMKDPCFDFFMMLHQKNSKEWQRKRSMQLMREWQTLYNDIRDNGLKEPLDFWREGKEKLVFWRGWRRLYVMLELHKRGFRDFSRVPCRVYKTKRIYQIFNAPPKWSEGLMKDNSIHSLGQKQFGELNHLATDKYWVHRYTIQYDKQFSHLRHKPVKLLEIGVYRGASLLLWREAFPKGQIFGLDKNTRVWQAMLKGKDRVKVFVGRQEDKEFLAKKVAPSGPYDIIIDDGGHTPEEQIASFESMWPHVAEGGIYVIEDLHGNYWDHRAKNGPKMAERIKSMVDDVIGTDRSLDYRSLCCYYNICFIERV